LKNLRPRTYNLKPLTLMPGLAVLVITASLCVLSSVPVFARNIIIFVADGLRYGSVNPEDAPTMDALRQAGTYFSNSHAVFPTFTTPNASAIATGHYLGDTGDFSNTLYPGFPIPSVKRGGGSVYRDPVYRERCRLGLYR
jgi:Type I phosphodiesterase / nucleotide pyrophosphatase